MTSSSTIMTGAWTAPRHERWMVSMVMAPTAPATRPPAFITIMLTCPNCFSTASAMVMWQSGENMSATAPMIFGVSERRLPLSNSVRISSAMESMRCKLSLVEQVARTEQPRLAMLRTMLLPMSLLPPDTTATFDARSCSRRRNAGVAFCSAMVFAGRICDNPCAQSRLFRCQDISTDISPVGATDPLRIREAESFGLKGC